MTTLLQMKETGIYAVFFVADTNRFVLQSGDIFVVSEAGFFVLRKTAEMPKEMEQLNTQLAALGGSQFNPLTIGLGQQPSPQQMQQIAPGFDPYGQQGGNWG